MGMIIEEKNEKLSNEEHIKELQELLIKLSNKFVENVRQIQNLENTLNWEKFKNSEIKEKLKTKGDELSEKSKELQTAKQTIFEQDEYIKYWKKQIKPITRKP